MNKDIQIQMGNEALILDSIDGNTMAISREPQVDQIAASEYYQTQHDLEAAKNEYIALRQALEGANMSSYTGIDTSSGYSDSYVYTYDDGIGKQVSEIKIDIDLNSYVTNRQEHDEALDFWNKFIDSIPDGEHPKMGIGSKVRLYRFVKEVVKKVKVKGKDNTMVNKVILMLMEKGYISEDLDLKKMLGIQLKLDKIITDSYGAEKAVKKILFYLIEEGIIEEKKISYFEGMKLEKEISDTLTGENDR